MLSYLYKIVYVFNQYNLAFYFMVDKLTTLISFDCLINSSLANILTSSKVSALLSLLFFK